MTGCDLLPLSQAGPSGYLRMAGRTGQNKRPPPVWAPNWVSIASSADGLKIAAVISGGSIWTAVWTTSWTWTERTGPGNQVLAVHRLLG